MKKQGYNPFRQGTFGDLTQYMRMGEIVLREAHNKSGFGIRTGDQMKHRLKWSNIIALWRIFAAELKILFTLKEENQTVFNAFTRLNMPLTTAYLTKDEYRFGGAVLFNMIISTGVLSPINMLWQSGFAVSDILLGDLAIGSDTTVGQFSRAVMVNNNYQPQCPRFRTGDCIKAYRAVQYTTPGLGTPQVALQVTQVRLDPESTLPLTAAAGFKNFLSSKGHLCANVPEGTLFAYVQTRENAHKRVDVSTQKMVGRNPLLVTFSSDQAFDNALASYGGINRVNAAKPEPNEAIFDASKATAADFAVDADLNIDFTNPFTLPDGAGSTAGGPVGGGPGVVTYTITPRVEPDASFGTITMVPSQMPVPAGTQVRLTATPAGGKRLVSWSDGSTEATIVVTADSNRTVTATFSTIATGGGGNGLGSKEM